MADEEWRDLLRPLLDEAGLYADVVSIEALTGGVSSDIVRVELSDGARVCAKRALPRLRVASFWEAPLERNHHEAAWLRIAGVLAPGIAPQVLAEDRKRGVFLLEYLAPDDYQLWKTELLGGRFDARVAERVAGALARIHAATWDDSVVAASFATDAAFAALRIEPYLNTLAERTPDLAARILAVAAETAATRRALVHGDVSPKNILIARSDGRPVLLDAECAWFGDPAFDAAFCINHLLLKAAHLPALRASLVDAAASFLRIWLAGLPTRDEAEGRLSRLLPCLLLARIDGKSPVEYLSEAEREAVRRIARPLISAAPVSGAELLSRFSQSLARHDCH